MAKDMLPEDTRFGQLPDLKGFKSLMSEVNDEVRSLNTLMKQVGTSASFTKTSMGGVGDSLKDIVKMGKQLRLNQKDIMSDKFKEVDVTEAISNIESLRASIQTRMVGKNKVMADNLIAMLDTQTSMLDVIQKTSKAQAQLRETSMTLAEDLVKPLDHFIDVLGEVPIVGRALQSHLAPAMKTFTNEIAGGLVRIFETGKISAAGFGSTLSSAVSKFSKILLSPLGLLAGLAVLVGLAVSKMIHLQEAAQGVREETGYMNSQTYELETTLKEVNQQYSSMGVTIDVAAASAKALAKEMGNVVGMNKTAISTVSLLNKNYGVGAEDAAAVYKRLFDFTGGNAKRINNMLGNAITVSKDLGVSFSQVMSDIAQSGEETLTYFNGDANAIMKAAINARRLGVNLKTVTSIADKLLDFDTSLEAEMNASAILGKSINFSGARYAFLTGQMEEGTNLLYDQVSALGDFNKLNVIQKKALSEAAGMSVEELGTMMNQRKVLDSMTKSERARYETGLKNLASMKEDVNLQKQQILQQQEMQSTMTKIGNMWDAIVSLLAGALLPIMETLTPLLVGVLWFVKTILDAMNVTIQAIYGVVKLVVALGKFDFAGMGHAFDSTISASNAFLGNFGAGPIGGAAEGAIVTKPTVLQVGEGGSPEAIVPLDPSGIKTQSDPVMLKLLSDILDAVKAGSVIMLDGRKVGSSLAMAASNPIQ